jgi:hypothetical protein
VDGITFGTDDQRRGGVCQFGPHTWETNIGTWPKSRSSLQKLTTPQFVGGYLELRWSLECGGCGACGRVEYVQRRVSICRFLPDRTSHSFVGFGSPQNDLRYIRDPFGNALAGDPYQFRRTQCPVWYVPLTLPYQFFSIVDLLVSTCFGFESVPTTF